MKALAALKTDQDWHFIGPGRVIIVKGNEIHNVDVGSLLNMNIEHSYPVAKFTSMPIILASSTNAEFAIIGVAGDYNVTKNTADVLDISILRANYRNQPWTITRINIQVPKHDLVSPNEPKYVFKVLQDKLFMTIDRTMFNDPIDPRRPQGQRKNIGLTFLGPNDNIMRSTGIPGYSKFGDIIAVKRYPGVPDSTEYSLNVLNDFQYDRQTYKFTDAYEMSASRPNVIYAQYGHVFYYGRRLYINLMGQIGDRQKNERDLITFTSDNSYEDGKHKVDLPLAVNGTKVLYAELTYDDTNNNTELRRFLIFDYDTSSARNVDIGEPSVMYGSKPTGNDLASHAKFYYQDAKPLWRWFVAQDKDSFIVLNSARIMLIDSYNNEIWSNPSRSALMIGTGVDLSRAINDDKMIEVEMNANHLVRVSSSRSPRERSMILVPVNVDKSFM